MAGSADAFKATRPRAALCTIDSCFSGQVPARVLETAARPRSAFALTGVYGEGGILRAACVTSQSAWEQPGTGHGHTLAVIEALNGAAGASVSFPEIAGEIIRLARVEAERISVTQTQLCLGNLRGGLVFPAPPCAEKGSCPTDSVHTNSAAYSSVSTFISSVPTMTKIPRVEVSRTPKPAAKRASKRVAKPARDRGGPCAKNVAIATELAPAVAIALLEKTDQPPGAPAAALEVLAVAAGPSETEGNVRMQLMFENGAVLPVEMSVDAATALSRGLKEELPKQ